MSRLNVMADRWSMSSGQGISSQVQAAIAAGSDYSWTRQAVAQNTALLWRTSYDGDSLQGFSGNVLCLGKPTDPTVQAVVFQNFEIPLKSQDIIKDHQPTVKGECAVWKAGFLLPAEIRQSEIEMCRTFR